MGYLLNGRAIRLAASLVEQVPEPSGASPRFIARTATVGCQHEWFQDALSRPALVARTLISFRCSPSLFSSVFPIVDLGSQRRIGRSHVDAIEILHVRRATAPAVRTVGSVLRTREPLTRRAFTGRRSSRITLHITQSPNRRGPPSPLCTHRGEAVGG